MPKTAVITLGETDYTIPAFDIGELEDIAEVFATLPAHKVPFETLRRALAHASPPVADPLRLEADAAQVLAAAGAIFDLNRLRAPPKGEAQAVPAAA